VLPSDPAYDEVPKIWNAMSERRPGGHNIAGNAVCDDGLMIDLSQMKSVRIDPGKRLAYVEPDAMGYTRPREFNSSFR